MARGWQPRKGDVSPRKEYIPQINEWDNEREKNKMQYQTELKMTLVYDTDGDPDVIVNELLNLFQIIDTTRLNLTWDNCEWGTISTSEYCKECGAYDPMQDEPQWHKNTCSINEGETK